MKNKIITDDDIQAIMKALESWSGMLTWLKLCESLVGKISVIPTRQMLNSNQNVKAAYYAYKCSGQ